MTHAAYDSVHLNVGGVLVCGRNGSSLIVSVDDPTLVTCPECLEWARCWNCHRFPVDHRHDDLGGLICNSAPYPGADSWPNYDPRTTRTWLE